MSEMITDVQSVFSSIASDYDKLNTILTLNIDKLWRKKAVTLCNIKENDKVLDLCCGTGKMIELECRAVGEDTTVTGLDFNREMINVGNKNLTESLDNYKFNLVHG